MSPEPGLFTFSRGADLSVSVEDMTTTMKVHIDPSDNSVQVSPTLGTTSAIVRFCHRIPASEDSLGIALRLRGLQAGQPVRARPSPDQLAVALSGNSAALELDVEVTHTNRYGETHIFESDGITVPALAKASLRVDRIADLARPAGMPLSLEVQGSGGQPATRQKLARKINGPAITTPHRIITRAHLGSSPTHGVDIELSSASPKGFPIRYRSLYGPAIETQEAGKLRLSVPPGTRPVRIVAEDSNGNRSFPRTVFVTVPHGNNPVIPVLKLYGEHVTIPPGTTGEVPLGVYLTDFQTNRLEFDFSVRGRFSGMGSGSAALLENGFTPSPELAALNPTIESSVLVGGKAMRLSITWDPAKKKMGRFPIGTMRVAASGDTVLGSAFLLEGKGTATQQTATTAIEKPVQVISPLIRMWGGPEPAKLEIIGPSEVVEGAEIELTVIADGIPVQQAKAGWWTTSITGRVTVQQASPGSLKARIKGLNAGWVKISAVVGTKVCETTIRVKPYVRPRFQLA
jgi:hypothetical protein